MFSMIYLRTATNNVRIINCFIVQLINWLSTPRVLIYTKDNSTHHWLTASLWPFNTATCVPLVTSHTITVLSSLHDTTLLPSGENEHPFTWHNKQCQISQSKKQTSKLIKWWNQTPNIAKQKSINTIKCIINNHKHNKTK